MTLVAWCLFPVALILIWLALELREAVQVGNPTCACGRECLQDAYMVHSDDYARISARLTELCPLCRSRADQNRDRHPAVGDREEAAPVACCPLPVASSYSEVA